QFFAQLRKTLAVCSLRLLVQDLARITQAADVNSFPLEIFPIGHQPSGWLFLAAACDAASQVERVKRCPRMAQQVSDVRQSLGVSQANRRLSRPNTPILALSPKNRNLDVSRHTG